MSKENINQKDEGLCEKCNEEPIFMNGLCSYCYEDEFYGGDELEDKHRDSRMIIHGQSLKDSRQQEINRGRVISKIIKKKK